MGKQTIYVIAVEKPYHGDFLTTLFVKRVENLLIWNNIRGGNNMQLREILKEAQSSMKYDIAELVDEYDEDGCLITILNYSDKQVSITLQDVKGRRINTSLMEKRMFKRLDYGNFKQLINKLFYYAQPME